MKKFIAAIVLAHVVSFGTTIFSSGFYHDDWTVLEMANTAHPVAEFAKSGQMVRPVGALLLVGLFKVCTFKPLLWHAVTFSLDVLASVLFFLVLGGGEFALAAALIAGTFPSHAITHQWISSLPQTLAICLALGALLSPSFIAGTVLYALGILSYEAVAFLPLLAFFPGYRCRWERRHIAWGAALAVVLVSVLAYQHTFKQRPMIFNLHHVWTVFLEGLKCVTYKIA